MNMHQPNPELPDYWKRRAAEFVQSLQTDLGITPDGKVGRETAQALAPLTDALRAQHRPLSEREHFMIEAAMQHGARMLDADGKVFVVTQEQLVSLMRSYRSPEQQALLDMKIHDWIAQEIASRTHTVEAPGTALIHIDPEEANRIAAEAVMRVLLDKATLVTVLANDIHGRNVRAGWWSDLDTGEDLHGKRNIGELLALVHSEVSEALEAHRKNLMDDKLPHRPGFRVELIDALIRIFDILGSDYQAQREHPAGVLFQEKLDFNASRADHKPENRRLNDGKKF